jgi:sugar lactone lactonase YvrE
VETGQTSQCSAVVAGVGNYNSAVTWSVDSGTISSSGLYTAPAAAPASGIATVKATSSQDSTKTGTESITITTPVASSGSVVIMTTPIDGGPANGPWQIAVSAVNSGGGPASGLAVALTSTEGTLSASQGTTNSNGTWTATITPPTTYAGEAVALSATVENQTAAVNIVFAPTVFNPAVRHSASLVQSMSSSSTTSTSSIIQPIAYGTSGNAGSTNPFSVPNSCFSSLALGSVVPASCQTAFTQAGISVKAASLLNAACRAVGVINGINGTLDCAGTALSIGTCLTGVGAEVCVGGLLATGPGCVAFLAPMIPTKFTQSPAFRTGMDIVAMGIQPDSPGLSDYLGLLCDDLGLPDPGTGSTGTKVAVNAPSSSTEVGSKVQLTSTVSGNSNSTVEWAINGVPLASGIYGTITSTGLYTAPAALPNPAKISITAASVADSTAIGGAALQVLVAPAGTISTVAGNGTSGYSGDGTASTSAQLNAPSGVAFDGNGNMFIADYFNSAVRRVDAGTGIITTIAGTGAAGYSGDGGPGAAAQLNGPSHVVFDRTVNLYITDAGNERIRKVNALTDEITTVAGNGTAGFFGDGGPATSAELNFPDGVALDSNGNLFIGDVENSRIREIAIATGDIATVAGNGLAGYSGDGGLATNAELDFPSRPFIDAAGDIYIADYKNNRIRKVNAATGIITAIAGNGTPGYSGDGGTATSAELNGPLSLALDASGVLYIADTGNERIRAVNTTANPITVLGIAIPAGQIQTVVGSGTAGYRGDGGPATAAQINSPTGLTFDLQGNLIFADANNDVVRKVIGQQ